MYRAEDTLLQRPVALKFLPSDSLTDSDKRRLLNEARAAARVRHPNICPVYDVEEVGGQLFIAMACLDGQPLSHAIARGMLGVNAAIDIALQIARGIDHAHQAGIVHRDIKASNVVLGPDGHISILDFGLALCSGAERLTAMGQAVGTPAYMSPEQAKGQSLDHTTDIWSMGVLLFEMLTGRLPFGSGGGAAMFQAILQQDPPALSSLRPGIPAELQRIVEVALAKQPANRWQSAQEMARQLEAVPRQLSAAVGATTRTQTIAIPASATDSSRPVQRNRKPAWYAAGTLALLAAGMYPLLHNSSDTARAPLAQPSSGIRGIAVLPFEVIGNAAEARVTSDGLVEILTSTISELAQFQGKFAVIPASEIRKRSINNAAEAKRLFGVALAITGSVQSSGDKLLFTVSLVDAAKLLQVHATHFEYDPKKPIELRRSAVTGVAALLGVEAPAAASAQYGAGDSQDPGAYAAYLHGLGFIARYDIDGNIDRAIASFQSATQQDPTYALAFTRLAESYQRKARNTSDLRLKALAITAAERAATLDPKLSTVHGVLGAIYADSARESDAIRELRLALEIDARNADAQRELASIYRRLGRTREAEESYVQATKTRPTDWIARAHLAEFYRSQERYREAETALKAAGDLTPDNDIVQRNLGALYNEEGRYAEAIDVLQRSLRLKKSAGVYAALGSALFYLHRFPEAMAAAENAVALMPRYYHWGNLGIYAKWTPGAEQKSTAALRQAIEGAEKALVITPNNYDVLADLAEYRARLGDPRGALAAIQRIPRPPEPSLAVRLAIAHELAGRRAEAIEEILSAVKSPASFNQVRNDPDLQQLWSDAALQRELEKRKSSR